MIQVFDWIRLLFTLIVLAAVTLPLVRNDYWVFRILEYPRFQKFLLCLMVLASWLFDRPDEPWAFAAIGALVLSAVYLAYKIYPYTFFSRREMVRSKGGRTNARITLFAANVYEKNRDYGRILKQIEETGPDLVFLVETDKEWASAAEGLSQKYPYRLVKPLENTYGLLLYSKLELEEPRINFIVQNDVPSVECVVVLRSGDKVRLWGLHPKPPVPGEDIRSTAKDKELMIVAEKAAESGLPVIVMGDLNDVAWSYTTELFRKTSRLLDPRRGRGFYSTFNAKNPFMRFPLDYIFCSNDFGLVRMRRLPKNGSDHFAMLTELQYDPGLKQKQERPVADREETEKAEKKKNA